MNKYIYVSNFGKENFATRVRDFGHAHAAANHYTSMKYFRDISPRENPASFREKLENKHKKDTHSLSLEHRRLLQANLSTSLTARPSTQPALLECKFV